MSSQQDRHRGGTMSGGWCELWRVNMSHVELHLSAVELHLYAYVCTAAFTMPGFVNYSSSV